jgi:hypothetical protein
MLHDVFSAAAELKFVDGDSEPAGTFSGLGAVYNTEDSHRDIIMPGAFATSLKAYAAAGTMPTMYAQHSAFVGGDLLPIGKWTSISEESDGLHVKGRLIALDHPDVKRVADLMREGAMGGLSIAFVTPPGGAIFGKKADEPRRRLKELKLLAIDVVSDPSHQDARIDGMKSIMVQADQQAACDAIGQAMQLHRDALSGGNSPNAEQRQKFMEHLQTAHMALTGSPMPRGMKNTPTLREAETAIGMMFGISNAQVRAITEHGLKAWISREENHEQVDSAAQTAIAEVTKGIAASLADFSLPKF